MQSAPGQTSGSTSLRDSLRSALLGGISNYIVDSLPEPRNQPSRADVVGGNPGGATAAMQAAGAARVTPEVRQEAVPRSGTMSVDAGGIGSVFVNMSTWQKFALYGAGVLTAGLVLNRLLD